MGTLRLLTAWAAVTAALSGAPEAGSAAASGCDAEGRDGCASGQAAEEEEVSLLQYQPRHGVAAVAAQEEAGICNIYEVCQCESGPQEDSTTCVAGTCRFDRNLSKLQYCEHKTPHCRDWADWPSWENCHWANFHSPAGRFPGENDILTALPAKSLSPELLDGLTGVTIFSDMDDTLICSGGGLAGVDEVCSGTKKGELYPGVAEFMFELTQGPSGKLPPQRVVPLSARPRELKQVLRIRSKSPENLAFKRVGGPDWGLDVDNALYGKMKDGIDGMAKTLGAAGLTPFRRMGYTKFKSWKKAVKADSWHGGSSIFVGDDGQGDLVAAQMMLKSGELLAAFIHDVRGKCGNASCRTRWAEYGVFLFTDYVDAAAIALAHGFISREGCHRVCAAKGAEGFACNC